MPVRRKEAVFVFWVIPLHDKSSKSGQDLGISARPSETKQKWGGWDTKEALGRESKSFGGSKRVDFIH